MKKKMFIAALFITILISSSIALAVPKETPKGHLKEKTPFGQWKKDQPFADQKEFVYNVHLRIKERLMARNELRDMAGKINMVNPIGLLKLINEYESQLLMEEELDSEEELLTEEPEEEEQLEEEPEEEPEIEEEEQLEEEPEEEPEIEEEEQLEEDPGGEE